MTIAERKLKLGDVFHSGSLANGLGHPLVHEFRIAGGQVVHTSSLMTDRSTDLVCLMGKGRLVVFPVILGSKSWGTSTNKPPVLTKATLQ